MLVGIFMNENNHHPYEQLSNSNSAPRYIRVPVEIVHSEFDFTINKTIKISERTNKILDINWTTTHPEYQINLVANRLWISGKLHAEITYTKINNSNIHMENLLIPWKKTCQLDYTYPPMIPLSNEKTQYDFINQDQKTETSTHFEQTIYQNEPPIFEIISTKIITTKNIKEEGTNSILILDIYCEKQFRIWQNQIIKL
jgi:hypothetical protein